MPLQRPAQISKDRDNRAQVSRRLAQVTKENVDLWRRLLGVLSSYAACAHQVPAAPAHSFFF